MKEQPHTVDVEVGKKIRVQRTLRKMSQTELGTRIGVTFQQVQKYERGSNRVSASKLVEIAKALGLDVKLFFDGLDADPSSNDNVPASEAFIVSRQGLQLNAAFFSISDEKVRDRLLKLVQSIAQSENTTQAS